MSFNVEAQQIIEVVETPNLEEPVMLYTEKPSSDVVMEMHEMFPENTEHGLEVSEPGEVSLVVEDLPGVEALDPQLEEELEANDADTSANADSLKSEEKKSKKETVWDWEKNHGHQGFMLWIKDRLNTVPKHSGYDEAGLLRAVSYMERLDDEISKAMRLDLDSVLDANAIEKVRAEIEDGVDRLHARLEKIKNKKKGKRKKKAQSEDLLIKEAQKATNITGITITVPLFISRIARICINSSVSAGKDIEDTYNKLVDKYDLTEREQAEVLQLLSDMGYPMPHYDRGYMPDEDVDYTSSDNFDLPPNYVG